MKKIMIGAALAALTVIILISILMPMGVVKAAGEDDSEAETTASEVEYNGSILMSYNSTADSFDIPSRVTEIGPQAFRNSNLKSIVIPDSVVKIDEQAFYDCKSLKSVVIENGVKSIGVSAFAGCSNLSHVEIPESVDKIGAGIFAGCSSLSHINLSPSNEKYFFNDGVLYDNASKELVQYLPGRKATSYEVPFTVKKIDRFAFWGASMLTSVRISNNIKEIPYHGFSNCVGLTSIYLPESVERIGAYGFSDCVNLSYVAMENPVVDIASTAFEGCNKNLTTDMGVDESESSFILGNEGGQSISDADELSETEPIQAFQEKNSDDEKAGITQKTGPGAYKKNFASSSIKRSVIDTSDPNLIGASKVVGGSVLVY